MGGGGVCRSIRVKVVQCKTKRNLLLLRRPPLQIHHGIRAEAERIISHRPEQALDVSLSAPLSSSVPSPVGMTNFPQALQRRGKNHHGDDSDE